MFKVLGSDQQVYGPVSAAQLRLWMAEGRVQPSTLIQAEGATDWKPLSSLAEFSIPPVPPIVNLSPAPVREGGQTMAMWGLICGILANLCCCASIFGILGLIFSITVLSRRQDFPGANHKELAVAGLILSIIGLLWHSLLPLFFFRPRMFPHFRHWPM